MVEGKIAFVFAVAVAIVAVLLKDRLNLQL
jgi:hypothetical protein